MSGGDFLDRWSRRKRETEAGGTPEDRTEGAQAADEVAPVAPDEAPAEAPDDSLLAALPDLSEIGAATDIRGFLQAGVPRALRNAALRRAWASDPAIADYTDPARDYFWDWNAPDAVPGNSGRLLAENIRAMADRLSAPAPEVSPEAEAEAAPAMPEPEPEPESELVPVRVANTPPPAPDAAAPTADATDAPPPRRHGSASPG